MNAAWERAVRAEARRDTARRLREAELEAIERRAIDALRGNASETDEYERGWLDACAEILGKRP